MNKALLFIRLDFITIKPYLTVKNLLIFVGVALFMLVPTNSLPGTFGILMALGALYSSYPFAIGEKSNIDVLYATLSIKRNTVVLGRYSFALTLDIVVGLFTFIFSFLVLSVMQKSFDFIGSLSTILVLFLLFSLIQAVQLPIYFKMGYTKAKYLAYLPFMVLPAAVFIGTTFFSSLFTLDRIVGLFELVAANPLTAALLAGVMWFGIMVISYRISLLFYQKRDF